MASKTCHYMCLVCCDDIEISLDCIEDITEVFSEKLLSLFWVFCGHMKVDCELTEDFDFLTEPFPFCKFCTLQLVELSRHHRKISSKKEENILKVIASLSFKILNTIHVNYPYPEEEDDSEHLTSLQTNLIQTQEIIEEKPVEEEEEEDENPQFTFVLCKNEDVKPSMKIEKQNKDTRVIDLMTTTRRKILDIRRSIINSYNVRVHLERIDPVSDKERLLQLITTQVISRQDDYEQETVEPQEILGIEQEDDEINPDENNEHFFVNDDDDSNESLDEDRIASKLFPTVINLDDDDDEGSSSNKNRKRNNNSKSRYSSKKRKVEGTAKTKAVVEVAPNKFTYKGKFEFEKVDDTYICSTCLYSSKFKQNLASHIRTQHHDVNRYECKYCQRPFSRMSDCKKHEKLHEERRTPVIYPYCRSEIRIPDSDSSSRKFLYKQKFPFEIVEESFKCGTCGHISANRPNMTSHIRNIHLNAGRYACKFCAKPFNRLWDLDRHELIHSTTADFLCTSCGEKFKSSRLLKYHEMTHQGIDPRQHVCECGQRFYKRQMLNRHITVRHKNEKPYECPVCFKRYGLLDSMKKHSRTHLQVLPYLCHICGAGHISNSEVLKHIDACHNPNKLSKPKKRKPTATTAPTMSSSSHIKEKESIMIHEVEEVIVEHQIIESQSIPTTIIETHVPDEFFTLIGL